MRWLVRNPKFSIPAGVLVLGGLAWLAFGFFGVHLLLVDDKVSEAPPVFAASETPTIATTDTADTTTPSPPPPTSVSTPAAPDPAPTSTLAPTTVPVAPVAPQPQVVIEYIGDFVGRNHPTAGIASVLGDGSGQRFLRFEEFATDNGPDLNVYLVNSSAGGVDDVVDLGDLKGNLGDQNYEIPVGTDLGVYDTVLIWCVRFSSAFGEATLSPT